MSSKQERKPQTLEPISFHHIDDDQRRVLVEVAALAHGPNALWLYDAFDVINRTFFDGRVPFPVIQWNITPYGRCVANCLAVSNHMPVVTMHPTLLNHPTYGEGLTIGTFIHELIHVAQRFAEFEGTTGETPHNSTSWVSEINRLSPALGIPAFHRRIVVSNGGRRPAVKESSASAPTPAEFRQSDLSGWPNTSFRLIGKNPESAMVEVMERYGIPRLNEATSNYKLFVEKSISGGHNRVVKRKPEPAEVFAT